MQARFIRYFSLFTLALLFSSLLSAAPATTHMGFSSPEEALKVLISTVENGDAKKLLQILGDEAKPILRSGDSVQDQETRKRFMEAYQDGYKFVQAGDSQYIIELGKVGWKFPIPLVKENNQWYFDTEAGIKEIFNRRIARNEISTLQAVLSYIQAQRQYYAANPQKELIQCYAQKFVSTPGKQDGLYYKVNNGEKLSPLGEFIASVPGASEYEKAKNDTAGPLAYQGYYYRILTQQGPDAPGGANDYMMDGKMLVGHALIAWPAQYGNTGIMTFITNQDGIVYQQDLGPNTEAAVAKITAFNPDKNWKPVKEEPPSTKMQPELMFP